MPPMPPALQALQQIVRDNPLDLAFGDVPLPCIIAGRVPFESADQCSFGNGESHGAQQFQDDSDGAS